MPRCISFDFGLEHKRGRSCLRTYLNISKGTNISTLPPHLCLFYTFPCLSPVLQLCSLPLASPTCPPSSPALFCLGACPPLPVSPCARPCPPAPRAGPELRSVCSLSPVPRLPPLPPTRRGRSWPRDGGTWRPARRSTPSSRRSSITAPSQCGNSYRSS